MINLQATIPELSIELCILKQIGAVPHTVANFLQDSPVLNGTLEPSLAHDSNSEGGFNGSRTVSWANVALIVVHRPSAVICLIE